MKTKTDQVLRTKNPNKVPFRSELFGCDISPKLLFSLSNKTYKQFVRDCEDPELLYEVMMIKRNTPTFPGIRKISRISKFAAFAAGVAVLFKGQQIADQVKCHVYRIYLPKQSRSHELQ